MAGETIQCASACTVTIAIEPAPPSSTSIEDMGLVWSGFLLVAIVAMGLRKVANVFDSSPHES